MHHSTKPDRSPHGTGRLISAFCAAMIACAGGSQSASGATLTFDDLASSPSSGTAVSGYGGLTWSNFYVIDGSQYAGNPSGYGVGVVSGSNVVFNAFGNPAELSQASAFSFQSGFFTGAWNDGLTVQVAGFLSGSQVHSTSFVVNAKGDTLTKRFVTFGWDEVDRVTFSASGGTAAYGGDPDTRFVIDDLTFGAAVVPEPLTFAAAGLIGTCVLRRRRESI